MAENKYELIYKKLYSAFGPQRWWPGDTPFEIIIGAILTQNTSWKNVVPAIQNLKTHRLLAPEKLQNASLKKISGLIKSSGYYNLKAKRISNFLDFLFSEYKGSLKKMFRGEKDILRSKLLGVSGIGPETADSIILYAAGKPSFVVDAYTRRIFSRHDILDEGMSYEEIKDIFEKNMPLDVKIYNEYHALIVKLGKDICLKRKPDCSICPINGI